MMIAEKAADLIVVDEKGSFPTCATCPLSRLRGAIRN